MRFELPLITPLSLKYYVKASENETEGYYRALDIRLCLEKVCDEMIKEFVCDDTKRKWKKFKLHDKLNAAKEFMPCEVIDKLIDAKINSNKGTHEGQEAQLDEDDLEESLDAIYNFSLEIFISYFKRNGFFNLGNNGSWLPVIFSTLPPSYRIEILKKYFVFDHSLGIIDKLSMSYLKNDIQELSFDFLDICLKKNT